ncbi:MAG TPA: hypothetical protein VFI20_05210 [Terracidiphilus sp.]|nr:hypothetical protein [Terracidiphilus sp.]
MSDNERKHVYRIAYDAANRELEHIMGAFEELRTHQDRIEGLLSALEPEVAAGSAVGTAVFRPLTFQVSGFTLTTQFTAVWPELKQ